MDKNCFERPEWWAGQLAAKNRMPSRIEWESRFPMVIDAISNRKCMDIFKPFEGRDMGFPRKCTNGFAYDTSNGNAASSRTMDVSWPAWSAQCSPVPSAPNRPIRQDLGHKKDDFRHIPSSKTESNWRDLPHERFLLGNGRLISDQNMRVCPITSSFCFQHLTFFFYSWQNPASLRDHIQPTDSFGKNRDWTIYHGLFRPIYIILCLIDRRTGTLSDQK